MESKVIQQFLGEIDGVEFDKENVYYSSEHILSKIEEKFGNVYNKEFVKELKKSKIKLSLKEEMEWEEIFLENKEEAEKIKNEIEMTDKEIDRMVYELYGLSEEEVRVVES